MRAIDLNADMGEYRRDSEARNEAALMALISSCSIACGGHTGNSETMGITARLARLHGVSIGAHPSYPDQEGFGRTFIDISNEDLASSIREQINGLRRVLNEEGLSLSHVKPHGALYNSAAKDDALAKIVVDASGDAIIFGPPNSALERAALERGNVFVAEGFIDRLYQKDGSLTPRAMAGAIIPDIPKRAAQGVKLARREAVDAADGSIALCVSTLCIHSDSPGALETAQAVRTELLKDGFQIAPHYARQQ